MLRPPLPYRNSTVFCGPVSAGGLKWTSSGKYAILFAATILAAGKLNDTDSTPWAKECAVNDAIEKANRILEKIDERWSATGDA
jgi:hypothetical protein